MVSSKHQRFITASATQTGCIYFKFMSYYMSYLCSHGHTCFSYYHSSVTSSSHSIIGLYLFHMIVMFVRAFSCLCSSFHLRVVVVARSRIYVTLVYKMFICMSYLFVAYACHLCFIRSSQLFATPCTSYIRCSYNHGSYIVRICVVVTISA